MTGNGKQLKRWVKQTQKAHRLLVKSMDHEPDKAGDLVCEAMDVLEKLIGDMGRAGK